MDPVVLALRTAIANKDSVELRVALGEHLLRTGDPKSALSELEAGLVLAASDPVVLEAAARAADACGETVRANAYRLAMQSAGTKVPAPERVDHAPSPLRLVAQDGEVVEEPAHAFKFEDVAGMEDVKERLERSFLLPLKNPELYAKFNKRIGGGLILYGPPGCGKTFVARAVAGEIGARFMNVGISDVLNMWVGESERRLHEIFENARRRAPTVLFFDELDALGQRRTEVRGSALRTTINQLLSELDGFEGSNDQVFFLAATNHPWDIDPALRRPGRFDRLVFVSPPDAPARRRLFDLKLTGRPVTEHLDFSSLVKASEGFSGADVAAVVELATELAIQKSAKTGKEVPIDEDTLRAALKDVRPSSRPWFETARNYAIYSNEGGTYDELVPHLKRLGLS